MLKTSLNSDVEPIVFMYIRKHPSLMLKTVCLLRFSFCECRRVDAIDEGRGPDAETQLLMEEDLLSQLRSTWSEVVMKDSVTHGLYASTLAHVRTWL